MTIMEVPVLEQSLVSKTLTRVKYQHHCEFLTQCLHHNVTPKGLAINVSINAPGNPSQRFQKRTEGILRKASGDLMRLLLGQFASLMNDLNSSIDEISEKLKASVSNDTFNRILSKLNVQSLKLGERLTRKRQKKLNALGVRSAAAVTPITSAKNKKPRNRRFKRRARPPKNGEKGSDNFVVNLSSHDLNESEKSLLSKGLGFCPRPKGYDRGKLIEDTLAFSRRMRLKSHFTKVDLFDNTIDPDNDPDNPSQTANINYTTDSKEKYSTFIPKSHWQPPRQGHDLETFVSSVESDITSHKPPKPRHDNLTKEERNALHSLQRRSDIVIKPADKGSAVVVMDRDHYVSEAERQLNDSTYYELLDHDPTDEFAKKVSEAVEEMFDDGYITEKNMRYLIVDQPKAGRFYLLPKIHKAGNPGRPIVSANGHPTEKISEFVDLHLQPHVNSLPSYLKDTTDYLRKLQESGPIPPETLLVSLDVTSLYTNIPHEDGIRACKEAWEDRPVKDPPTEILVKLLTLILKCNNFEFKGKHYLQVQGTAMGTKMAPAYANIFMGRLEGQLLRSISLKPFSWFRFIDDVDMKWTHGPENLEIFLQEANSFHPTIRFTVEVSNEEHVFLDTKSRLVGNSMNVDLYTKPTDTHQYLLPSSCHPKHCSRNVPYSLALRIRRICSNPDTFESRATELSDQLRRRGYNIQSISTATSKARSQRRDDLLRYKPKPEPSGTLIPFVLTYHPELPKVKEIVNKHWPIIESSKRLNKIFPQKPIMAYRRPKSLRDILVHAKLNPDPSDDGPTGESKPCGNKRCFTCKLMTPTQIAKSSSGASVKLKRQTNCKSANVIYLITCTQCGKQYVGETKRALNERMNGHRSDWTKRRFQRSPVAEHFHLQNHDFNSHVSLCCIDHDAQWSDDTRKARENYWIRRLNTMQPHGINKGD